jgi:hypothetical protein
MHMIDLSLCLSISNIYIERKSLWKF